MFQEPLTDVVFLAEVLGELRNVRDELLPGREPEGSLEDFEVAVDRRVGGGSQAPTAGLAVPPRAADRLDATVLPVELILGDQPGVMPLTRTPPKKPARLAMRDSRDAVDRRPLS